MTQDQVEPTPISGGCRAVEIALLAVQYAAPVSATRL